MTRIPTLVIVVVLSVTASVALLEGLLRRISPNDSLSEVDAAVRGRSWFVVNKHRADRVFGYTSVPNVAFDYATGEWRTHVETNAYGFRGPEFTSDTPSIFVVGDSFVRAPQLTYDKVATFHLQQLLAASGYAYVVNNLGVESYSMVQYYNVLRVYGARWRPRVAVVVLWGNDLPRDDQFERSSGVVRDDSGVIIEVGPDTSFDDVPPPTWYQRSYLFWLGKHAAQHVRGSLTGRPRRPSREFYWGLLEPGNTRLFEATTKYLLAAERLCHDLGIALVVSALPFGNQVGTHQNGVGYHTTGSTPVAFEDRTQYPDAIRTVAREHHIHYIDILAEFRGLARAGEKLYFTWDGHLNAQGNRRLAEAMYRTLTMAGLVDRSR